jgi:hypothetical protein
MSGTELFQKLEEASGMKYEQYGIDNIAFANKDHQFSQAAVPHQEIQAALKSNGKVIMGKDQHMREIFGMKEGPNGILYKVRDPWTSREDLIPAEKLGGQQFAIPRKRTIKENIAESEALLAQSPHDHYAQ